MMPLTVMEITTLPALALTFVLASMASLHATEKELLRGENIAAPEAGYKSPNLSLAREKKSAGYFTSAVVACRQRCQNRKIAMIYLMTLKWEFPIHANLNSHFARRTAEHLIL